MLEGIYQRGERVLGRAVFAAKCSVITQHPTTDWFYGPAVLYTLFGDPALRVKCLPGADVEETPNVEMRTAKLPTIVRGVLTVPESWVMRDGSCVLHDAAGRKVLDLHPGANDVSGVAPGVYFVRTDRRPPDRVVILP